MSSRPAEPRRAAIRVPDLDSGPQPLLLVQWLVDPGTEVLEGDRVAEVLVSGILFQVASPVAGRLARFEKGQRATVMSGEVIGWIESESG